MRGPILPQGIGTEWTRRVPRTARTWTLTSGLQTGNESTENDQFRHSRNVARVALKFGESALHLERTVKCEALDDIRHFTGSTGMAPGSLVAAEIRRLSDQSELSGAAPYSVVVARCGLLR